jgi:hypothetical protein
LQKHEPGEVAVDAGAEKFVKAAQLGVNAYTGGGVAGRGRGGRAGTLEVGFETGLWAGLKPAVEFVPETVPELPLEVGEYA